jgi:hypothetical protein
MKRRLTVVAILLMTFFGYPAWAADWWLVAWDNHGEGDAIAYVDKSRIERINRGSRVNAWAWTVFREDQNAEFGKFRSEKSHLLVDCEKLQLGPDRSTLYSAYGGVVHEIRQSEPSMEVIAPASLRGAIATFICSEGKQSLLALPVYEPTKDAEQRFWLKGRQNKP